MTIIHILLFEFKPNVHHEQVQEICTLMLGLREQCIHTSTNKPYIKSLTGGRDNSPAGQQGGFTHGFVVEFENEEDRKYYLESDPAHLEFAGKARPLLQNIRVVDYEPGVY